jgi:hypothetical protein
VVEEGKERLCGCCAAARTGGCEKVCGAGVRERVGWTACGSAGWC